ncbi:MAG: hypothetical protein J3R72DRAFT_399480, partial [Linnemannia gamsii]
TNLLFTFFFLIFFFIILSPLSEFGLGPSHARTFTSCPPPLSLPLIFLHTLHPQTSFSATHTPWRH